MSNILPLPTELQHLLEKREREERRTVEDQQSVDVESDNYTDVERRSGSDRRGQPNSERTDIA
jgi:hypothetical protein